MASISVRQVGKAYRQYPSRLARMKDWVLPWGGPRYQLHWVLRDISFDVNPGETVGLAGANGAGKSTLLKMIVGILKPTEGEILRSGRVAALLELGMGFHPEFTGRQNLFMAGQIMGMTVDDIAQLLPEIEAFAEIGEAIDHPVRTYSSGMQVRLAFSLATARRPDLLIVDEALSVGDAYFQHKSFDRIRSFRRDGTTLLIVSHNRHAIQTICDRAILLDKGTIAMQGPTEPVMDYYHALMADKEALSIRQRVLASGQVQTISGSGEVTIEDIRLFRADGKSIDTVQVGEPVRLEVLAEVRAPVAQLTLGFMIKDRFGQPVYGINTYRVGKAISDLATGQRVRFHFDFCMNLGKGNYSMAFCLSEGDSHLARNYEWRDYGLVFQVINTSREDFVGSTWLNAATHIHVENNPAQDPSHVTSAD